MGDKAGARCSERRPHWDEGTGVVAKEDRIKFTRSVSSRASSANSSSPALSSSFTACANFVRAASRNSFLVIPLRASDKKERGTAAHSRARERGLHQPSHRADGAATIVVAAGQLQHGRVHI